MTIKLTFYPQLISSEVYSNLWSIFSNNDNSFFSWLKDYYWKIHLWLLNEKNNWICWYSFKSFWMKNKFKHRSILTNWTSSFDSHLQLIKHSQQENLFFNICSIWWKKNNFDHSSWNQWFIEIIRILKLKITNSILIGEYTFIIFPVDIKIYIFTLWMKFHHFFEYLYSGLQLNLIPSIDFTAIKDYPSKFFNFLNQHSYFFELLFSIIKVQD